MPGMSNHVEEQLKRLPAKPGVYLFRDDAGDLLYVGKAKSLRPRVRSYFQRTGDGRAQIATLPGRVADVEVIVTGSVSIVIVSPNCQPVASATETRCGPAGMSQFEVVKGVFVAP